MKNEEEKRLVWKLSEKPSGSTVAELVAQGVISKEEARAILFREETKSSDEVEALKEMVKTLQDMVKDLLARPNPTQFIPYTKVVEVDRRFKPYWDTVWCSTGSLGNLTTTSGSSTGGAATYTMSLNQ